MAKREVKGKVVALCPGVAYVARAELVFDSHDIADALGLVVTLSWDDGLPEKPKSHERRPGTTSDLHPSFASGAIPGGAGE